ncbi:hypothetical protein LCGC14_1008220 [marine sediment metagenome]|uniref:Glycosyltransferase 2-like domain-containing protein n=1 Tax=marine sediment metagenome TaxID=412755 RepID=A0A0F9R756_9ZZZZ
MVKISTIIRCRDEERWIGHSIQSVLDFVKNPEIIIIDNNSTDDSRDVVRMFEHHVDIGYKTINNYSPGKSINLGVKDAKHDYILLISAHCTISKMNINDHISQLNENCVVFGKQTPFYRGRRAGRRYIWKNFGNKLQVDMFSKEENRYFLHNAFALYKKEVLLSHSFDEILYGKEDRYWIKGMIELGYHSIYDPSMECIHHWTPGGATWKGIG